MFGAATIAVLASVLVNRYQRVYARKLFINEEIIDFHDYSDDENNDADSKCSIQLQRGCGSMKIEDPDRRARADMNLQNQVSEISQTPTDDNNPLDGQNESGVHFIIGYVDDDRRDISSHLLQRISSAIGESNIQFSTRSTKQQPSSSYDVQFKLSSPSDDEQEELTEITHGCGNKGNVLRTFPRSRSSQNM